jgi:hypothetical protein
MNLFRPPVIAVGAVLVILLIWVLRSGTPAKVEMKYKSSNFVGEPSSQAPEQIGELTERPITREPSGIVSNSPLVSGGTIAAELDAKLIVHVFEKGIEHPLEGLHVQVSAFARVDPPKDSEQGGAVGRHTFFATFEENFVTDETGSFEVLLPSGQLVFISVNPRKNADITGRKFISRSESVAELLAGESKEVLLEMQEFDSVAYCWVVDADSGLGLTGVVAERVAGSDRKYFSDLFSSEKTIFGNANGVLEIQRKDEYGDPIWVHSAGYSPSIFLPAQGNASLQNAFVLRVLPSASLQGLVLGPEGPLQNCEVELSISPDQLNSEAGSVLGGSLRSFGDSAGILVWQTGSPPGGSFLFEDLPTRVPLALKIRKTSNDAWIQQGELVFEPGEVRRTEFKIGTNATLTGTLLTELGEPVPDREIWIMPNPRLASQAEDQVYFSSGSSGPDEIMRRTNTNDLGEFTLLDIPPGEWWVGPGATESVNGICAIAQRVLIGPEDQIVELNLTAIPGLTMEGGIYFPDGTQVKKGFVSAYLTGKLAGSFFCALDSTGKFTIGPVSPGEYKLMAVPTGVDDGKKKWAWPKQTASAGDINIRLVLSEGFSLSFRTIDALSGVPISAEVIGMTGTEDWVSYSTTDLDGRSSFDGLSSGTYSISAKSVGNKIGFVSDIQLAPSSGDKEVEIFLQPGGSIRLSYHGSHSWVEYEVRVDGRKFAMGTLRSKVAEKIWTPVGELQVVLKFSGSVLNTRNVSVKLGEDTEVVVR